MRVCIVCKELKKDNQFYSTKTVTAKKKIRTECKQCTVKKKRIRERQHNKEYDKWFKAIPKKCESCGEERPYVIDFHHMDASNKSCEVSQIKSKSWTADRKIATAQSEIAKCMQLCSNCHREFHHLERNFAMTIEEYMGG